MSTVRACLHRLSNRNLFPERSTCISVGIFLLLSTDKFKSNRGIFVAIPDAVAWKSWCEKGEEHLGTVSKNTHKFLLKIKFIPVCSQNTQIYLLSLSPSFMSFLSLRSNMHELLVTFLFRIQKYRIALI